MNRTTTWHHCSLQDVSIMLLNNSGFKVLSPAQNLKIWWNNSKVHSLLTGFPESWVQEGEFCSTCLRCSPIAPCKHIYVHVQAHPCSRFTKPQKVVNNARLWVKETTLPAAAAAAHSLPFPLKSVLSEKHSRLDIIVGKKTHHPAECLWRTVIKAPLAEQWNCWREE